MYILFECVMLICFTLANLIWLIRIFKKPASFHTEEKLYSITSVTAFLIGILQFILECHPIDLIICLLGFVTSEFTVAATFYEYYKDLEIPHE